MKASCTSHASCSVYIQQVPTTGLFKHACLFFSFIFAFQNQSNPFGHIRHCLSTLRCHAGFEGFCGLPQELLKTHTRLLWYILVWKEWMTFCIYFDCMKVSHQCKRKPYSMKYLLWVSTLSTFIWAMTKVHVAWYELCTDLGVDQ